MIDPLLLLAADTAALFFFSGIGRFLPRRVTDLATVGLSGPAALLCLALLLSNVAASGLELPIGPPGLSLHLALDPISAFFLFVIYCCGTAVAICAAASVLTFGGDTHAIPFCLAALSVIVLASDPVTLAIGLTLMSTAMVLLNDAVHPPTTFLPAPMLLIAVCVLNASSFMPHFDAIRAVSVEAGRAAVAGALAIGGGLLLLHTSSRHWAGGALTSGAVIPCAIYLLIRFVVDLLGIVAQAEWGFVLLLAGGAMAVIYGWRAAQQPGLNGAVACLTRRQAGLATIGLGLTLIARSADLPDAASFGLAATLLLMLGSAVSGTLAVLAAYALGYDADTDQLVRLGGLGRSMPIASISFAASLLALSALPPGSGFAALWLLLESILLAPRTGGLISQLPLALAAGILALSSSLATAAAVRLIGVAVLSRPRSARGSAAVDVGPGLRPILLTLSGISMLVGILPGLVLEHLADPAVRVLTNTSLGERAGWATLSNSAESPGYSAMPVLALLALATGAVALIVRRLRKEARISGVWNGGVAPAPGLPLGDPAAQSAGGGFLPALPAVGFSVAGPFDLGASQSARTGQADADPPDLWHRLMPHLTRYQFGRCPWPIMGLWAILLAFSVLLLLLAVHDGGGLNG